jgi:hypothetical protein
VKLEFRDLLGGQGDFLRESNAVRSPDHFLGGDEGGILMITDPITATATVPFVLWMGLFGLAQQSMIESPDEGRITVQYVKGEFNEVLTRANRENFPGEIIVIEPRGEYAEIDVEVTNEVLTRLSSPEFSVGAKAARDVAASPDRYAPPALFVASSMCIDIGEEELASFLFNLAWLRSRTDAWKCNDLSARAAVTVLLTEFSPRIRLQMLKDYRRWRVICMKVIEWDRTHEREYDPRWIALHGIEAFTNGETKFEPEDQWAALDEKGRQVLRTFWVNTAQDLEAADKNSDGRLSSTEDAAFIAALEAREVRSRYKRRNNTVKYSGQTLENIDVDTFEILGDPTYARDKTHIYFHGHLVPGADADSFEVLERPYSRDKSTIYCGNVAMPVKNPGSFEVVVSTGYPQFIMSNKRLVFEFGDAFANVRVSTDRPAVVESGWARDGVSYYFGPARVEGADYGSFVVVDEFVAKDRSHTYRGPFPEEVWPARAREVFGAGPSSLEEISFQ